MPISAQNDQFAIIQDLLKRQDEALDELESLDKRVEKVIQEVNAFRQIEAETVNGEASEEVPKAA